MAADRFVDAAGVNVHLHYDRTLYRDDFPLVMRRLVELGVRHVRDGLIDTAWRPYYERHNALGRAGIKGTFITSPDQPTSLWADYPARMSAAFEAYEAPNEYNKSKDPNWAQRLVDTLTRLRSLKSDQRVAHFPVLGPSLTTEAAYAEFGNHSALFDAANIHHYFAGRHPGTPGWGTNGYGSIAWNLALVRRYSGNKPIVTTESGYQDLGSVSEAVPPQIAGRYMPRVLLEQFRAGVARTYLYELADFPNSGGYGLLNADGSPKPAFTAVKGLLNLLADPGPAFAPRDLGYTVHASGNVRHMAFQKRDGTYFLALWLALPSYNPATRAAVAVAPESIAITFPRVMRQIRTHRWQTDGSVSSLLAPATTSLLQVAVTDALTVVELRDAATAGSGTPAPPGSPTVTVNGSTVALRWQPSVGGGAPEVYGVEAATNRDFSGAITLQTGMATEVTVPGVGPGLYFVRVRAANAHGISAPSGAAEVAVGAPSAPSLVAVQVSTNPVVLAWSPASGATHYVLSAGSTPGASDLAVVTLGAETSIVAPVPTGIRFYVRVAAVNAYGASRSNEITFAVGAAGPPATPAMRPPLVHGSTVGLSWTPVGGATSYFLIARAGAGGPVVASAPVAATGVTVTGVPRGTYAVSVAAMRGAQPGGESAPVIVSVP